MSGEKKADDFQELLKAVAQVADEAETLAKAAAPAPDDKIVAAAASDPDGDGDNDANPEDDEDGDGGKGEEFGKSMGKDSQGNDLVDATELVKSLMDRQDASDGVLAKALTSLTGALSKQNELIKSLQSEVKTLAGQGRGRKTLVTIAEKPGVSDVLAKSSAASEEGKITPAELLAKSNAAWDAGKISGAEYNTVDVCLRNGWSIDPGILRKVAAA